MRLSNCVGFAGFTFLVLCALSSPRLVGDSFAQENPPTEINRLIKQLTDKNPEVRQKAAFALGKIGPKAEAAVPALSKALKDENFDVRWSAAEALGEIGPKAEAAVPALIESLTDPIVRSTVAESLAAIAVALQDGGVTDAIENLEKARIALADYPDSRLRKHADTVSRAVKHLELVKEKEQGKLWRQAWEWITGHPTRSLAIGIYLLFPLAWLLLLWFRPVLLLDINELLKSVPEGIGIIKGPISVILWLGPFLFFNRPYDAWVKGKVKSARESFSDFDTVKEREVHVPVPVDLNGKLEPELSSEKLRRHFSSPQTRLLISGEGGAGKTSLACQFGKWAMAEDKGERLANHLMLPILIEHDFGNFLEAISGRLRDLASIPRPVPESILRELLLRKRIIVIVDHLSEMSADTRSLMSPGNADFPANALLVTSRLEEQLEGVKKTVIGPRRIAGNRLSSFMEAYLTQRGKRQLFTDSEFFDGCSRLSSMVGDRNITPLLAKLYADQMVEDKEGTLDGDLSTNIPDLMRSYVTWLNRNAPDGSPTIHQVHEDARRVAWECVRPTYRPGSAPYKHVTEGLEGDGVKGRLDHLERHLRLIRSEGPEKERIRITLDPLAEYLAGLHILDLYSDDEEL
jgi:HEAT repeat protein